MEGFKHDFREMWFVRVMTSMNSSKISSMKLDDDEVGVCKYERRDWFSGKNVGEFKRDDNFVAWICEIFQVWCLTISFLGNLLKPPNPRRLNFCGEIQSMKFVEKFVSYICDKFQVVKWICRRFQKWKSTRVLW